MPAPDRPQRRNIRGSVEGQQAIDQHAAQLHNELNAAVPWLQDILPSHANAHQYAAILDGMLNADPDLARAAILNTPSFLAAVADCARLGLTPGDGYAFVPLGVGENARESAEPEVVGWVEYTGEIQRMYNSGAVTSVIAEVVRQHDYYRRGSHEHEPPEFERRGANGQGDDFLTADERGPIRGVFAYALFDTGATSKIIRMGRDEVEAHEAVARTKKIWRQWRASMYLKTAVHELYKWTPKSAEYLAERWRATSAFQRSPAAQLPLSPAVDLDQAEPPVQLATPPGGALRAIGNGDTEEGKPPQRRKGRQPAREDEPAQPSELEQIIGLLNELQIAQDQRTDVFAGLLDEDTAAIRQGKLGTQQRRKILGELRDALSAAEGDTDQARGFILSAAGLSTPAAATSADQEG